MPNNKSAYSHIPPQFHGQEGKGTGKETGGKEEGKDKKIAKTPEDEIRQLAKMKMDELTPDQLKKCVAESEKNENLLIMLNNQIHSKIIAHGLALIKHDEMKLWRYKDYHNMRTFMAAISCQAHGYHAMAIAKEFILNLKFEPEQIEDIGEKKLMMILNMVKDKPKKEANKWIDTARKKSASDLKKLIKKAKGEPVSEVDFFAKGNELFIEDGKLFLRGKEPSDVYDLSSLPKKYPVDKYKYSVVVKIQDRKK